MSYDALKYELEHDPLKLGYSKMSDAQVAQILSRRDRPVRYTKVCSLRKALESVNVSDHVIIKQDLEMLAGIGRTAAAMLRFANAYFAKEEPIGSGEEPDLGDPDVLRVIDAMPNLSTEVKFRLRSMQATDKEGVPATKYISRAEELELVDIAETDIVAVRTIIDKERHKQ